MKDTQSGWFVEKTSVVSGNDDATVPVGASR